MGRVQMAQVERDLYIYICICIYIYTYIYMRRLFAFTPPPAECHPATLYICVRVRARACTRVVRHVRPQAKTRAATGWAPLGHRWGPARTLTSEEPATCYPPPTSRPAAPRSAPRPPPSPRSRPHHLSPRPHRLSPQPSPSRKPFLAHPEPILEQVLEMKPGTAFKLACTAARVISRLRNGTAPIGWHLPWQLLGHAARGAALATT